MKTLYWSLSHSHLNYGILTWGYRCNRLVKLQNRLICIVILAKYNAHTDPLFKQAAILKISDMLRIKVLNFCYKHQHGQLANYFYNFNLTTQGSHHSYDTRSSEQIRTDRTRAEFCDNGIRLFLSKVINSIPANLLQKLQLTTFRVFFVQYKNIYLIWIYCNLFRGYLLYLSMHLNNAQPFSTGFVHAKLTSASKCSITPSLFFIVALLFDVRTICILPRHEDATVIIQCITTGGIRDSGTSALTDISSQFLLVTWS